MATRKKLKKSKVSKKPKVKAKKPARKVTKKKAPAFHEASTLQIAVAEIMGDIEERMALDRLGP